jgi:hypothetical protein
VLALSKFTTPNLSFGSGDGRKLFPVFSLHSAFPSCYIWASSILICNIWDRSTELEIFPITSRNLGGGVRKKKYQIGEGIQTTK